MQLTEFVDDYKIVFDYIPAERGTRQRDGLPLEPDCEADIELLSVKDNNGKEVKLTEQQVEGIVERLLDLMEERLNEPGEPDYDD